MLSERLIILLSAVFTCFVSIKSNQTCSKFTPNYKTVFPGDCKKYMECYRGELSQKKCIWLQYFSPSKSHCSLWKNCDEPPAPIPKQWWENVPDICEGRPNFKINSPWGYRHYLICENGILSVGVCPWNYPVFDPEDQDCHNYFHSWKDKEYPLPDKISTTTITTSSTSSSTTKPIQSITTSRTSSSTTKPIQSTTTSGTSSSTTKPIQSTTTSGTSSSTTKPTQSTTTSGTSSSTTKPIQSTTTSGTSSSTTKPTQSTKASTTVSTTATLKTSTEDAETTTLETAEPPENF